MKEKKLLDSKLATAVISLVIALVLVGMGTLAWFTISQKPEVGIGVSMIADDTQWPFDLSNDYDVLKSGATWEKETTLNLPECLLRPITTYDMQYWFVADYDTEGNVCGYKLKNKIRSNQVDTASFGNFANIPETSGDLEEELANYIVYDDIWIKTRQSEESRYDKDGNEVKYELRLNNPMRNFDGSPKVDSDEVEFGTYAIFTPTKDGVGPWQFENYSGMACLRIGFEVTKVDPDTYADDPDATKEYFIYEPNSTKHFKYGDDAYTASGAKSLGNDVADEYEKGIKDSTVYVLDNPDTGEGQEVSAYDATEGTYYSTKVPRITSIDLENDILEYSMENQPIYLMQRETKWDTTRFGNSRGAGEITSLDLDEIGEFFKRGNSNQQQVIDAPYSELSPIATIGYGEIYHIRVYFWLEGQDIDCWNEVAGGELKAHLEFRGDAINQ